MNEKMLFLKELKKFGFTFVVSSSTTNDSLDNSKLYRLCVYSF